MSPTLDYTLLCKRCLKDFRLEPGRLSAHVARCRLPYTTNIVKGKKLAVFCLSPSSPIRHRRFAANSVVLAMHESNEISADLIGWYAVVSREERETFCPHAFIPVMDGLTAGVVIVNRKPSCLVTFPVKGNRKIGKLEDKPRWCINRIWIAEPYRRKGIARKTIKAIASYFKIKDSGLAWAAPLTPSGYNLARSIAGNKIFMTA